MRRLLVALLIVIAATAADAQVVLRQTGDGLMTLGPKQSGAWTSGQCVMAVDAVNVGFGTCPGAAGGTHFPGCTAGSNQLWSDSTASGTASPQCTLATASGAGTLGVPNNQFFRWVSGACFERSGSGEVTISTDCSGTRAFLITGRQAINRTTSPQGRLSLSGESGSHTNGPHLNLYVDSVSEGPVVQLYGHETTSRLMFGQFWNGAVSGLAGTSTNATSNFLIVHSSGDLVVRGRSGVALGGDVVNLRIMAWHASTSSTSFGDGGALIGITRTLGASATIDFTSISAHTCLTNTITVTSAAAGDLCTVGVPSAASTTGVQYTCEVRAANTVTVLACNANTVARDPTNGLFKVFVLQTTI